MIPVFATQAEIRTEGAELFKAAGWIEPRPTAVRVAALATGVIEELLVVEDQLVKKGEPVAELIKADAILIHNGAVANRELAEAELERNQAACAAAKTRFEQPVHLEAKLAAADADLAKINTSLINLPFETQRAKAELEFAKGDYERMFKAAASVSEREVDRSRADLKLPRLIFPNYTTGNNHLKKRCLPLGRNGMRLISSCSCWLRKPKKKMKRWPWSMLPGQS